MREHLVVPNRILRQKCEPILTIDSEVRSLVEEMVSFMLAHKNDPYFPIGLSAPQLGALIRLIVFYPNSFYREEDGINVLINPEISRAEDIALVNEGCISIPGKNFTVQRARRIKFNGLNLNGEKRSYKCRDLFAQVIQHEVNHLDGILVDTLGERTK